MAETNGVNGTAKSNGVNGHRGPQTVDLDALVVGAGFGGIYQLKKFRDMGLNVKAIDTAGDVGGTWYWNQYPGAMSDTEAYLYRYSWDADDLQSYPWDKHYVYQAEVLKYLQHVVERHDLRRDIILETTLTDAAWDDEASVWAVKTSGGRTFRVRYLVTALGLLSKQNFPNIRGIDSFQGEKYHTGAWPTGVSLQGKRVGVIGNGSTGVQVVTEIAKDVAKLVSFQRNPQYSVPSGQRAVDPEYRRRVNENYQEIWRQAKDESKTAFGFKENEDRPAMSVDAETRQELFETAWAKGGGFRFMFETFNDISTDEAANGQAAEFIKAKIRAKVKDPVKARKLMPTQLYARRPLCDAGYYEQFNRSNVEVVSLHETPIDEITPKGIRTSDGVEHELDVIIFATGFDAVDGNYTRIAIKGRDGVSLKEHWEPTGPTTFLGLSVTGFPNMFMILGPNGPFCNIPPAIETHVEFISDIVEAAEKGKQTSSTARNPIVEATAKSEALWTDECDRVSRESLFRKTDSWIFGANVPGKRHAVMFYFGGLAEYRTKLRKVAKNGWDGFSMG
ncbi:hypothetical protein B0A55_05465 [Friedmanniomyces simplex]|uniref:FAD/NAD(P)-binding domain-containing protein n=1 Tax=Friedmanniomyces simplex TaxID=329884 RepID=A0A4U0X500_9PEZI|nr:hypothetical protein B0A55_05465 [Friedmanniomyces simplex]